MDDIQKDYLRVTARWQKFLGIVYLVSSGLLIIAGIIMVIAGAVDSFDSDFSAFSSGSDFGSMIGAGVGYTIAASLNIVMGLYLVRSAKSLQQWLSTSDDWDLTNGLENTKSFFKFNGIVTIVALGVVAVAMVVLIIAGVVSAL